MSSSSIENLDAAEPTQALVTHRPIKLRHKLGVLSAASVLAVVAAELILRLVAPQYPSWLEIYRKHPIIDTYTLLANVNTVVDAGEGRYTVRTDENGRRVGRDGPALADPRPLMLVVGDSYTFGQGVSYEDSIVGQLDTAPGMPLRPINTGVGGYGPVQYRIVLDYLLGQGLKPRFVLLVTYPGNDFHDCIWNKNLLVADGIINNPRTLRAWVKRSSHLYRWIAKVYHQYAPADPNDASMRDRELATAENWEVGELSKARKVYAEEFKSIKSLCESRSLPLGVVLIPSKQNLAALRNELGGEDGADRNLDFTLPTRQAVSICEELGLRHLDLTEALVAYPTDDTYLRFDGHFTPFAGRIAGEAIQDFFVELQGEAVRPDSR